MRNGYGSSFLKLLWHCLRRLGVYKYANGNIYWGNYVNDIRSGKGKSEFITGGMLFCISNAA